MAAASQLNDPQQKQRVPKGYQRPAYTSHTSREGCNSNWPKCVLQWWCSWVAPHFVGASGASVLLGAGEALPQLNTQKSNFRGPACPNFMLGPDSKSQPSELPRPWLGKRATGICFHFASKEPSVLPLCSVQTPLPSSTPTKSHFLS